MALCATKLIQGLGRSLAKHQDQVVPSGKKWLLAAATTKTNSLVTSRTGRQSFHTEHNKEGEPPRVLITGKEMSRIINDELL